MPPKISSSLPPSLQMKLRPNRAAAPGKPDMPMPKRPSAVVSAEREAKDQEIEAKRKAQNDGVAALARLEDNMHEEDKENEILANHPPISARRKAAPKAAIAKDKVPDVEKDRDGVLTTNNTGLVAHPRREVNPSVVADSEEEREREKARKKKERKERKTELRARIMNQRENIDGTGPVKRAGENIQRDAPANKKAKPSELKGLRADFSQRIVEARLPVPTSKPISQHTTANTELLFEEDYDADRSERAAINGKGSVKANPLRYNGNGAIIKSEPVLAKITPNLKVTLPNGQRHRGSAKKKDDMGMSYFPPTYQEGLRLSAIPIIRQSMGYQAGPWDPIPDGVITYAWSVAFPDECSQMIDDEFLIVYKLANDRISTWRNNFATAAMKALEQLFDSLEYSAPEDRAEYVKFLLGDDEKDRLCPFYYKEYEEGKAPIGIFQSYLISQTLATHITSIAGIPPKFRHEDKPVAALVLTVQAVKRALIYYRTGRKVIPSGPLGFFSKTNWGDHVERREGRDIPVKTTSKILKLVKKLNDVQWDKILEAATCYAKDKTVIVPAAADSTPEDSSDSDFELEDGDEDLAPSKAANDDDESSDF